MTQAFQEHISLKFQLYNSLFLNLPFGNIRQTGNYLPLLSKACEIGFDAGKSPTEIINHFFDEYFPQSSKLERRDIIFHFIQYIERQVVLFDAVEDAAFNEIHDINGQGTIHGLFERARILDKTDKIVSKLEDINLRIVLTAHPTQFYPGTILGIITDLGKSIQKNELDLIESYLRQLGKTPFLKKEKPTPYDEATSLIWYLENVFYDSISEVIYKIEDELSKLGKSLKYEDIIEMGFWPGGDRDGNPFVTTEITEKVAKRLKRTIQVLYFRDIRQLKRRLTFPGVYSKMAEIERRLYQGINGEIEAYQSSEELLEDLRIVRDTVIEKYRSLFLPLIKKMITKVKIFGLHLAIMDVRQDSSELEFLFDTICDNWPNEKQDKWNGNDRETKINLLESMIENDVNVQGKYPVQQDTLDSFHLMERIQQSNGKKSCHRYIISNSQHAVHVLMAFHLARLLRNNMDVDIVPLFETIDDLRNAAKEMEQLYTNVQYKNHLKNRLNKQTIMLGFSDGTKDGGYLSANLSIYQAKEALTDISRKYGIDVAFFDGRGGPPARGGGKTNKFYASLGNKIEDKQVQITIQGQTISSNFGTHDTASFNIEQLLSAGLENSVFQDDSKNLSEKNRHTLIELANISLSKYKDFKQHPKFLDYLSEMGTLPYYGATNIGSRPVKRAGGGKLTLKKLRAIPFVGSWSQMKQNVPGYFGLGMAIEEFADEGMINEVVELYQNSAFFQALIQNSMMSLSKCYFPLTAYLSDHPRFGDIWNLIHDEYQRTKKWILHISGESELLANSPDTKKSIELREKLVLPLLTIQQYALDKTRDSENEDLDIYHKIVLRTMFGIINAGRNSA